MNNDVFVVLNVYLLLCFTIELSNFMFHIIKGAWLEYYINLLIIGAIIGIGLSGASVLNGDILILPFYLLMTYFINKRLKLLNAVSK